MWKYDQLSDFNTNMRKVVVASDSFKGCLTSAQVADAVEKGIHEVYPQCEVVKLAVADGGEGTMAALMSTVGGERHAVTVHDPVGRQIEASYALINGNTAVIEMASASGLTLLEPHERNPLLTSTYGTGELIADALDKGCRRFLICLGGSATNDAGMGMLQALGYRFMGAEGQALNPCGGSLANVVSIQAKDVNPALKESEFIVACDVDSPFCGPEGAAYVYGPQKGATHDMVRELDGGMRHFAGLVERVTGTDPADMSGAGAAGGLGGALMAFMNARLCRGADMVLDAVGFDKAIANADLIITGEGRIDSQTATGKLPYAVAKRSSGIPVLGVCGRAEVDSLQCFRKIVQVTPPDMPLAKAMNAIVAAENVRKAIMDILLMGSL